MVYVACYDDRLCLWWDLREDKKEGMRYKITVNDKNCVYTDSCYFDFKNLEGGRQYDFLVQVVDEADNVIGRTDALSASTFPRRERIDVSLPPYGAVGNGKVDNTAAVQRAIDENTSGVEIYLPLGVYVCRKLKINGDYDLRLDSGASLKSLEVEE